MAIKETLDRIHGVGTIPQWKLDTTPRMKVSVDEMKGLIKKSREMLQNRIKSDKRKSSGGKGKANTVDTDNPCPKCGASKWDQFPDGRGYCLKCGAVKELDGTVTGGAINKIIPNKGDNKMINGEVKCEKCGKHQPFCATLEELIQYIQNPHKDCGGKISFSLVQINPKDNESKSIAGAKEHSIGLEIVPEKSNKCDHPKRDIFICNRCRDFDNCSQKNIDAVICLLINLDMKLKRLLERMPA